MMNDYTPIPFTRRPLATALDAFLCHTWAVTVTGAPKTWAMRFIEQSEPGLRHWYGGAVGIVSFDGSLNTGLTLRTIRVKNGVAEVRAGATLLHERYHHFSAFRRGEPSFHAATIVLTAAIRWRRKRRPS